MQRCSKCLEEKPDDQFRQRHSQGLQCLDCFRAKKREYKRQYHRTPKGRANRTAANRRRRRKPEVKARHAANRRAKMKIDPERFRQAQKRTYSKLRDFLNQAPQSVEASKVWAKAAVSRSYRRAKKKGWDFNLAAFYLLPLPTHCPVFGMELRYGPSDDHKGPAPNSATLDRLDNDQGYVRDNVRIMSHRANVLKLDATVEELETLVDFLYREMI